MFTTVPTAQKGRENNLTRRKEVTNCYNYANTYTCSPRTSEVLKLGLALAVHYHFKIQQRRKQILHSQPFFIR